MEESQNPAKVGEILINAGIIDEMQLSAALGEQNQWGRRLGATLIKLGMVSEADLIRALALQHGLPVASVAGKRIPEDVIALVPSRVAFDEGVLPLFVKPGDRASRLYLGMEDPSNLAVLDDLSFRTGLEIQPVMVGPTELSAAIDRFYLRDGERSDAEKRLSNETLGELNLRRLDAPMDELGNMVDLDPNEGLEPEPAVEDEEDVEEGPVPESVSPIAARPIDPAFASDEVASESDEPEDPDENDVDAPLPPLPPIGVVPAAVANPTVDADPDSALKALRPFALEGTSGSSDVRIAELEAEIERAHHESAKTRAVVIAMTQILHERGLLPFELLQQRTAKIKSEETSD